MPQGVSKKAGKPAAAAPAAPRVLKKGRMNIAPKTQQKQAALKLQKKFAASINRHIEETLAAKASSVKSLKVLTTVANAGAAKLAADPKAGRTGRAVKGVQKKN